jgi:hypothetical protein
MGVPEDVRMSRMGHTTTGMASRRYGEHATEATEWRPRPSHRALDEADWVPGWIYRAAITRAEKAEAIAESAVKSVDAVAATVQKVLDDRRTEGR